MYRLILVMAGLDPAILFVPTAPTEGHGPKSRHAAGEIGSLCRLRQEDGRIKSGHDGGAAVGCAGDLPE
jgi:hypothetical protein